MKKSSIPQHHLMGMNCLENLAVAFVRTGSLAKDPVKEVNRMTEDPVRLKIWILAYNCTRIPGKEERIFFYENGKQIFY